MPCARHGCGNRGVKGLERQRGYEASDASSTSCSSTYCAICISSVALVTSKLSLVDDGEIEKCALLSLFCDDVALLASTSSPLLFFVVLHLHSHHVVG